MGRETTKARRRLPSTVAVSIRVFGQDVGSATIDVAALTAALDGDGIRAPRPKPLDAEDLAAWLLRYVRSGSFGGLLETETQNALLEHETSSPVPHVRERRRTSAALKALKSDRDHAWTKDTEGKRVEVTTEPWPALAIEFVRRQVTQILLYGTDLERGSLLKVFAPPIGRPSNVRGGRWYAADLKHYIVDVIALAKSQPVEGQLEWLNRQYPDVAAMLRAHGYDSIGPPATPSEIAAAIVDAELKRRRKKSKKK